MIWYFADEAKTTLLWVGATMKAPDGNIYKRELTDDEMYNIWQGEKFKKKEECRQTILSRYKEHDQLNIIRSWDQAKIDEMNTYIDAVLDERKTKWKDADFSQFNS